MRFTRPFRRRPLFRLTGCLLSRLYLSSAKRRLLRRLRLALHLPDGGRGEKGDEQGRRTENSYLRCSCRVGDEDYDAGEVVCVVAESFLTLHREWAWTESRDA